MNKKLWLLFCVCSFHVFIAQQRDPSIILYDRGNAAVARKDYRTADSLFTLSLDIAPHPDSYYNRAVCRRQLKNFNGYCLDLNAAAKFGDTESEKLFWKQCAKRDTVFKRNNGNPATKDDFEYVEFVTSYRYNTNFEYSKHDTSGNCMLSKIREENIIMYKSCNEVAESNYKGSIDSLVQYIKTETNFLKHVKQNNLFGNSYFSIVTNELGKVKEVKNLIHFTHESEQELITILLNMPDWKPAIYNSKAVKFKNEFSIKFYNDVLKISVTSQGINNSAKIFTVVEEMPEFPGGPMEMMRYVQKNITYPHIAKENGLQGKCFLKFVVNAEGMIVDIEILKGIPKCPECDKEAIRVIQSMPAWKPGKQNGKAVSVFFNLPINFQLR